MQKNNVDDRYPLVSILCPCKNREKTIRRCINSILAQDYPSIEIIVQDGASTDGTLEILQSYGQRIQLVSEPDSGPEDAFGRTLARIRGAFFGLCLSDEELLPHAVSWAVENLQKYPEVAAIYGDTYLTDIDGNITGEVKPQQWDFESYLCSEWTPPFNASFFRTSCFQALDMREYVGADEFDFWIGLAARFPIRYVPGMVGKYAVHPGQSSRQVSLCERWVASRKRAIERLCNNPGTPERIRSLRDKAIASLSTWRVECYLRMGALDLAKKHALEAFRNEPNPEKLHKLAGWFYYRGRELYRKGSLEQALECVDLLVKCNVVGQDLDYLRAKILQELGQISEATEAAHQDLKVWPGHRAQKEHWPKGQTLHAIGDANSQNKVVQSKQVRVAADYVQAGTQIGAESSFGAEIRKLFAKIRPRKIIETGTYLGAGTTTIISRALEALGIRDAVVYTIEVNPQNYARAKEYFAANNMNVQALNGLSVPRSMLPDRDQIARRTITDVDYDGIFVDHREQSRVELYYGETDFPQVEDDLLYKCLERFDFRPDFVLLDSAGHMGSIEFDYLIENLQGECYIALDDIYHVKHHGGFQRIQSDPRFEVITASKEKFGFCIAHFRPKADVRMQAVRHLLWVRTDSIGDAILASSTLPFVREKFGNPKITVVCRSHIAELYESCPYVDAVLTFDEKRMLSDPAYASGVLENVRSLSVDCTLNAVYSRDIICDYVVAASGARLRIGMYGNLCNISEELRTKHNQWYTHLLPSAKERKGELKRHADFLSGLGCNVEKLTPQIWLTPEDEAYADDWFRRHDFCPEKTVALFAGVQSPERIYAEYGKAIAGLCKENGFSVIALGAGSDRELNQRNLTDIENAGVQVCDFSGTLTLRQSAAIIKRCRLAVGAETGLAHIAAAVQTPHVIVIGGGQFGRFMPYSALTSLVCLPLECYGCGWKCKYRGSKIHCVASIAPAVIERAVRETLATSSAKPLIFVQDASLWNPSAGEPEWRTFDELLDAESAKIVPVGRSIESEPSADRAGVHCDVSIVVATKDRGELLDAMLSSLKGAADGIDYEVIVVEGGSCDGTRQVLRKHGITQVYDESQYLGPGRHSWPQLYNFGFSKARGRWAMYASDDVVFEKGSLAKAVNLLRSQKSQSVAGGVFFYKEIIPDYPGWERQGICFALGHKLLMNFGLIRLDVFNELGGLDGAYVFYCSDIDLSFKVYQSGRQLIPLAGCLLTHNNVQDGLKHKNLQTADTDYEYLVQKWKDFVPSRLDPPKRLFWDPSYEAAFVMPRELEDVNAGLEHFWHGFACLQIGRFHEATRWFSQALNAPCKHWTVFWLVAEALHQAGCQAEAQKTADFVLRINPGCAEIQPLLARLKRNSVPSVLPGGRNLSVAPTVVAPRSHFVIEVKYGGIGDHLFYSHLPRIAKQSGKYDKVYVSNRSEFRSEEYRRLIWELNPYVDGFCDEAAEYPLFDSVEEGMNILDKIMLLRGLDDGKRFHEPELYLRCRPRLDLSEAVIYDPNFVSYVGDVSTEAIERFLRENRIHVTHQMKLWEKNYALGDHTVVLQTPSLSEFCRAIVSCRQLLCLSSGTATLAAAMGRAAIVFYGDGQKKMFHHSRLHEYVNCSGKAVSISREPVSRQIKDLVQA